jgi:hypothetical protein
MFNSPLHYCAKCKQYVELDQSKEECAAQHGCGGLDCPLVDAFNPPDSQLEDKRQKSPKPATGSKSNT